MTVSTREAAQAKNIGGRRSKNNSGLIARGNPGDFIGGSST